MDGRWIEWGKTRGRPPHEVTGGHGSGGGGRVAAWRRQERGREREDRCASARDQLACAHSHGQSPVTRLDANYLLFHCFSLPIFCSIVGAARIYPTRILYSSSARRSTLRQQRRSGGPALNHPQPPNASLFALVLPLFDVWQLYLPPPARATAVLSSPLVLLDRLLTRPKLSGPNVTR